MLADLRLAIGSLDRVTAWVKLLGLVNAAPGFNEMPRVINGASDVLLAILGVTVH